MVNFMSKVKVISRLTTVKNCKRMKTDSQEFFVEGIIKGNGFQLQGKTMEICQKV